LEFTRGKGSAVSEGGKRGIAWRLPRSRFGEGVQEQIQALIQNLNAYPRWLVASCGIVLALTTLWFVGKLLKWTLYVIITLAMVAVVGGGVYWWLGQI